MHFFKGPLQDKLKTAQQKEITLKETLVQQAAKFEMFQGLLNDSNGKFGAFKGLLFFPLKILFSISQLHIA